MDITLEEGRIVLVPVRRRTRAGWDDASKARNKKKSPAVRYSAAFLRP
jgi:hypothetical protein